MACTREREPRDDEQRGRSVPPATDGRDHTGDFRGERLFGATLGAGFSWYDAYASTGTAALIRLPIFTFELTS